MPKFEVGYGVIYWHYGVVEADSAEDARAMVEDGEYEPKCHGTDLYDGIEVVEIKENV